MDSSVRHPRTLALVRTTLYLATLLLVAAIALTALGYLGVVAAVGGIAVLFGGADPVALVVLAGLGFAGAAVAGGGVLVAARRLDAVVTAADARPDPVEALKRAYVRSEVDEDEFERRVERLLDPTFDARSLPRPESGVGSRTVSVPRVSDAVARVHAIRRR